MAQGLRFISGATPGLSKLAAAIAGKDQAYGTAYDDQLGLQSKIAQALATAQAQEASARAHDANAAESTAKAGLTRTQQSFLDNRPSLVEELTANAAGTDVPMVKAIRKFVQTGQRAQVPMGPPTEDGTLGVGSQQFDPALQGRVAQQLARLAPALLSSGDIKVDDWAKAQGTYRGMDLGDQVLAGTRTAADVGRSQAAVEAKPLYHADSSGGVLDLFGGRMATDNPLAQGTIVLRKEQAGQAKAGAAENYAQAENARASAARTKAETETSPERGGIKAPKGYRWKADGSLEPIPGGPADATTKTGAPTEDERKAAGWVNQAQFAFENMQAALAQDPNAAKPPLIATAAGVVPGVGSALRNSMTSEARQKFEQAASSFAEAALRAATGAGVTEHEAKQKVAELTPQVGDKAGTIEQKKQALQVYLASLKARAGRAMQTGAVPTAPAAPGSPRPPLASFNR